MILRPYQQEAHDNVIAHIRKSLDPCLVQAPTGSGKSHIIASVAKTLYGKSGKRILCIAPSKELVKQNHAKYLATGEQASIYSASIAKSLRHPVVFGTPLSIKNDLKYFKQQFCAVIIDECHRTTKSILDIIEKLRFINENLRVIGLTATPHRLGEGYIYGDNKLYTKVYDIDPQALIDAGYLCNTKVVYPTDDNYYSTISFAVQKNGMFKQSDLSTIESAHQKTANIIHDVVMLSEQRPGKTIIFATTIKHAIECHSLLPAGKAGIVTTNTKSKERDQIIEDFRNGSLKYVVNVQALTTGLDVTTIDTIALLRVTESKSLLQQMIGRGLRPDSIKKDCLILDYAENIKRHCRDDRDIFSFDSPEVEKKEREQIQINAQCPKCFYDNEFAAAPNPDQLQISRGGYFMLLDGTETSIPAHLGRRCNYIHKDGNRCEYRWIYKDCNECGFRNDIAAKHCGNCDAELINPDDKLHHYGGEYTVKIKDWELVNTVSKKGRALLIAKLKDIHDKEMAVYFITDANKISEYWLYKKYDGFMKATKNLENKPSSISYEIRKGFINITGYNNI